MKFIVTVRGKLKSTDPKQARADHDATVERLTAVSKPLGALGHQTFLDPQNPQMFLAIDSWESMEGLQKFMSHAANPGAAIGALFEAQPEITVWGESGWKGF